MIGEVTRGHERRAGVDDEVGFLESRIDRLAVLALGEEISADRTRTRGTRHRGVEMIGKNFRFQLRNVAAPRDMTREVMRKQAIIIDDRPVEAATNPRDRDVAGRVYVVQ